eukprot:s916_g16.t1
MDAWNPSDVLLRSKALAFSPKLAADRTFVLQVLEKDGLSLQYVAPSLKADPSVVLVALQQNGESLQFAPDKFRESRKVVEVAVKQNPKAIRFASESLREDEEFVKEVAEIDGSVLQFASETLCGNWRVASKAVAQSWEALPFEQVDGGLSREVLLGSVKQDWRAIKEILQKSPVPQDFLVEAAALNPEIVRAQQLRGNKEVALTALSSNGLMLHYLLPDLRADPELASVAIRQNPDAMGEVHPCLRIILGVFSGREKDLLNIQTEGLARRARMELRRMKAEAAAAEAAQAMQEAIVPDADTAADAATNAAADAAADEAFALTQEVSQEELEDGAELVMTPSRPQRALEEDVNRVAPSLIGKVDVETASNAENGLPQCVVCLDEIGNMVLLPCAHGGVCEECTTRIVQNRAFGGAHCPHCRSAISTIVKLEEVEGEMAKGIELRIPMARPVS